MLKSIILFPHEAKEVEIMELKRNRDRMIDEVHDITARYDAKIERLLEALRLEKMDRELAEEAAATIEKEKDAEIAKLRKVVDAIQEVLPVMRANIPLCAEIDNLRNALAELEAK